MSSGVCGLPQTGHLGFCGCHGVELVQGWADAGAGDFGEAKIGEAQELGFQRIGFEGGAEGREQFLAGGGFHAGKIDENGAGEIAERDLAGELGDQREVQGQLGWLFCGVACGGAPASISMAVSAGVTAICMRAPERGLGSLGSARAAIFVFQDGIEGCVLMDDAGG